MRFLLKLHPEWNSVYLNFRNADLDYSLLNSLEASVFYDDYCPLANDPSH